MSKNITKYSNQDLLINHRAYNLFSQIGMNDGWTHQDKWENFAIFMDISRLTHTPFKGSNILDVGCGTGDLVKFLSDKEIKDYVGVDVFEPAIEKAKDRFPDKKFIAGDFLKLHFRKKFDFVYCSGALTTHLDTNNYDVIKSWIPKMWDLAKKGVVFNFLMEDNNTDILFYYDPKKVLEICETYMPQARIHTVTTDAGSGDGSKEMHVFLY